MAPDNICASGDTIKQTNKTTLAPKTIDNKQTRECLLLVFVSFYCHNLITFLCDGENCFQVEIDHDFGKLVPCVPTISLYPPRSQCRFLHISLKMYSLGQ